MFIKVGEKLACLTKTGIFVQEKCATIWPNPNPGMRAVTGAAMRSLGLTHRSPVDNRARRVRVSLYGDGDCGSPHAAN